MALKSERPSFFWIVALITKRSQFLMPTDHTTLFHLTLKTYMQHQFPQPLILGSS